jgi:hypothetical protein
MDLFECEFSPANADFYRSNLDSFQHSKHEKQGEKRKRRERREETREETRKEASLIP